MELSQDLNVIKKQRGVYRNGAFSLESSMCQSVFRGRATTQRIWTLRLILTEAQKAQNEGRYLILCMSFDSRGKEGRLITQVL